MRIYMAGSRMGSPETSEYEKVIKNRLLTFFERPILTEHYKARNLFLDSGAYSAYTQKKEIVLSDYINYIKTNLEFIECYCNLDVIGNAVEGWKNQRRMQKEGLSPLPVFHIGEDMRFLHKCIEEYPRFCIGGIAKGYSTKERILFLDRCFSEIQKRGLDNKVHGLGVTSYAVMLRYPWDTVDSTAWCKFASYGHIIYLSQKVNNGLPQAIDILTMSNISKKKSMVKKNVYWENIQDSLKAHILKLSKDYQVPIGQGLAEECNEDDSMSPNGNHLGLINDYKKRNTFNVHTLQNAAKLITKHRTTNNNIKYLL